MCYEFQVLFKILPKLNSIHVPNNKYIQLMGKTFLQSLQRLFLPGHRSRFITGLTNFSKTNLETSNETRLYLLKLYLCYTKLICLTDLLYQYIVPLKYRLLNTLQLCSTNFFSIYWWFCLQLLQSKKHLKLQKKYLIKFLHELV